MDYRSFLKEIAPYVVVVGSFARGEESFHSDIDCFLRSRPREDVDLEVGDETFMPEILDLILKNGLEWSSVLCGHVAIDKQPGFPRMIEISSHYRIPVVSEPFYRDVDEIQMLCARDDKNYDFDFCYDSPVWDDDLCDVVIKNLLPSFSPHKKSLNDQIVSTQGRNYPQTFSHSELSKEPEL